MNRFAEKYSPDAQMVNQSDTAESQPINRFAQKYSQPQAQQPTQQAAPAQPSQNWFMDKVDILNHAFDSYALGGLQLANKVIGSDSFGKAIDQQKQISDTRYQNAMDRTPSPYLDIASNIGAATAFGAPAAMATTFAGPTGGLLATVGKNAVQGLATGAMAGGLDYTRPGESRLAKTATSGLTGAILGGGIAGGLKLAGDIVHAIVPNIGASSFVKKMFNPKAAAAEDLASNIKQDLGDQALPTVTNLVDNGTMGKTPGEAIQTPIVRAEEARLKVTSPDELGAVSQNLQAKQQGLTSQIQGAVDNMASPADIQTKNTAFDAMKKQFVTPTGEISTDASMGGLPDLLKNNKVLSGEYSKVLSADTPDLKNAPDNSIYKLWAVKDSIDDKLYKAQPSPITGQAERSMTNLKQQELRSARSQLINLLKQSPEYNSAMDASQKLKIQDHYNNLLETITPAKGSGGEITPSDIYQKMFKNDALKSKFVQDVITTGGDPVQANELLDLTESFRDSPLSKVVSRGSQESGTRATYNKANFVQRLTDKLTLEKYHKAFLDLTLSGDKWANDVADVLKASTKQAKQEGYLQLISKVANTLGKGAETAISVGTGRAEMRQ